MGTSRNQSSQLCSTSTQLSAIVKTGCAHLMAAHKDTRFAALCACQLLTLKQSFEEPIVVERRRPLAMGVQMREPLRCIGDTHEHITMLQKVVAHEGQAVPRATVASSVERGIKRAIAKMSSISRGMTGRSCCPCSPSLHPRWLQGYPDCRGCRWVTKATAKIRSGQSSPSIPNVA